MFAYYDNIIVGYML